MPVYEFSCNNCGARLSLFFRSMNTEATGVCEKCGSTDLRRLFSKFAIHRAAYDPSNINQAELLDGLDERDPQSMAAFFRRMNDKFGEEPGVEMEEMITRLERGESVESTLGLDSHEGHNHGGYEEGGDDGDSGEEF
jgi:putative FmdB family regulatory protein